MSQQDIDFGRYTRRRGKIVTRTQTALAVVAVHLAFFTLLSLQFPWHLGTDDDGYADITDAEMQSAWDDDNGGAQ